MSHAGVGRSPFLFIAVALCASLLSTAAWTQGPAIKASAAVLMDRDSGMVLFDQAMHARLPPASTTKIMTALIVLESGRLSDTVIVGADAAQVESPGLDLEAGELLSLDDLLTALLLESSNAAAIALADHVAGGVSAFCRQMNDRARALGARDTHFTNPHGLHEPDHYSSAHDLALITRQAMRHLSFRELVAQKTGTITRAEGPLTLENHNKLLWRVDYVDGVKTGYVRESGHCLVASGTKDGWQLIAVVLDSPDTCGEALALLEYGFSAYRHRVLASRGDAVGQAQVRFGRQARVPAICQQSLAQVTGPGLPAPGQLRVTLPTVEAPLAEGAVVGEARLVVGEQTIASSPLLAAAAVPRSWVIVVATWALPVAVALAVTALGIRTGAKLVKGRRRGRRGFPPQGSGFDPRGPGLC